MSDKINAPEDQGRVYAFCEMWTEHDKTLGYVRIYCVPVGFDDKEAATQCAENTANRIAGYCGMVRMRLAPIEPPTEN